MTGVTFYPAGPIDIRDGTAERLQALPGLTAIFYGRTAPGQDSQLPYALVWNAGERTEPNGEANAGAPSFMHRLTLVVDVLAQAPSGTTPETLEAVEAALDADIVGFAEAIRATLLTDPSWVNLAEGIERCDTRYSYPKEAQAVMAQATIEFELTYRSVFEPVLPNDLHEVEVRGPLGRGTPLLVLDLPGTRP